MAVDETELEHGTGSALLDPHSVPFPIIALGLLALSASYQRGLENFLTVHIRVENN